MTRLPSIRSAVADPVLVVGGYGYRNVGDEAILAGLLRLLEPARVTVVSRSPAETTALHGVPAVGLRQAVDALRRHRTVLIGGGGLFGRDMGRLGRLLPGYGLLAAAAGRRVLLEGIGLDADMPPVTRRLVRRLASVAERVAVRDRASARMLADWGIETAVGPDLSARMAPVPVAVGEALLRQAGVPGGRPVIGLALTAVNPALAPAVEAAVATAVDRLTDLDFCLVPMSQHPFVAHHNDFVFARRIQAVAPRVSVLEGAFHPAAVLSVFGRLSAVVGMRFHSLLFAERAKLPLVPLAYAPKCDAWLAERGMASVAPDGEGIAMALTAVLPSSRLAS